MSKFKTWKEIEKGFHFTKEEEEELEIEKQLIRTTIELRKKANLTQRDLSEKSGMKQPSIAKIENYKHSPQVATLIRLLVPMGYTLRIVPLKKD